MILWCPSLDADLDGVFKVLREESYAASKNMLVIIENIWLTSGKVVVLG